MCYKTCRFCFFIACCSHNIWCQVSASVCQQAQHKGLSFCRNERWIYHGAHRAPNKSPDARVMHVDISLVPFHYTYQWAFLQMSEEWKISPPIVVRLHTDHTKAAAPAICSSGRYCNNRGSCRCQPPKLFNIRCVSCGAVVVVSKADSLQPCDYSLCLFLSCSPLPSEWTETRQDVL